jgi:hypothetical protein
MDGGGTDIFFLSPIPLKFECIRYCCLDIRMDDAYFIKKNKRGDLIQFWVKTENWKVFKKLI